MKLTLSKVIADGVADMIESAHQPQAVLSSPSVVSTLILLQTLLPTLRRFSKLLQRDDVTHADLPVLSSYFCRLLEKFASDHTQVTADEMPEAASYCQMHITVNDLLETPVREARDTLYTSTFHRGRPAVCNEAGRGNKEGPR